MTDRLHSTTSHAHDPLPAMIDDGLVLRRATPADADQVADLAVLAHATAMGFAPPPTGGASPAALWVQDMVVRPHPTMSAADVLVVEDVGSGTIVSTANVIPQTWTYGCIPFGVGRVEAVATDPACWRRGLVRRQFEMLHRWSAERGDLAQMISGIPHFYRRFGYEMALAIGGGRAVHRTQIVALPPGAEERISIRTARLEDVPALVRIDRHAGQRSLVACPRDEPLWRYELDGRSSGSFVHSDVLALEADGRVVGFALLGNGGNPMLPRSAPPTAVVSRFEVTPDASWYKATHALLRHLTGRSGPVPGSSAFEEVQFLLGAEHPAYAAAPAVLSRRRSGSAWYVRVPDLPRFLEHIRPVLEARLASSVARGYTGELLLNFYREGLRLTCREGRLSVETRPGVDFRAASASFPELSFLQLLFGHRGLAELDDWFDDVVVRGEEVHVVLDALFPRTPSAVWPLS